MTHRLYAVGDRVVITDPETRSPFYGVTVTIVEIMQDTVAKVLGELIGEEFEQAFFMRTDDGEDISGTNRYVSPEGTEAPPRPGIEAPFEDGLPPAVPPTHWFGIGDKVMMVGTRHVNPVTRGKTGVVVEIAPDSDLIQAKLRGSEGLSEATQALFIRLDEPTGFPLLDLLYRDKYPVANTDLALIAQAVA